uniref:(northern house mosquito) hypothetical protein n=1 Tax=Culex pipiens TaxID=7175 RepID=A0A8D8CMZ1_CULPI
MRVRLSQSYFLTDFSICQVFFQRNLILLERLCKRHLKDFAEKITFIENGSCLRLVFFFDQTFKILFKIDQSVSKNLKIYTFCIVVYQSDSLEQVTMQFLNSYIKKIINYIFIPSHIDSTIFTMIWTNR